MAGKFISEIHPPCYADKFTPLQNKISAFYLEHGDNTPFLKEEYNLIFIDSTSILKGGVLKYDHSRIRRHFSKGLSTFYHYDSHSYFYPALKDTIYRLGVNQIIPVYAFNFGKDGFDKRILQRDVKNLESRIKNIFSGFRGLEYEELRLCPMKKLYLGFNGEEDYLVVLVLYSLVGVFILLMSSFNYINLTTANAATRGREVAVKKASGSNRLALVVQFLGETVMISLLAAARIPGRLRGVKKFDKLSKNLIDTERQSVITYL